MTPPADQLPLFPDDDEPPKFEGEQPRFKSTQTKVWSGAKARMIELYIRYFLFVTHHGIYIDGFSGPQNPDRLDHWTAKRIVELRPRWIRNIFLGELKADSVYILEQMLIDQPPREKGEPKRTIDLLPGDFNQTIDTILESPHITSKQATFCLLDQRCFECDWATVLKVATKKQSGNRIEILYFLPIKWLQRALSAVKEEGKLDRWFGNSGWRDLVGKNNDYPRAVFVEKFKSLGYRYVKAWPIYAGPDMPSTMYYMIHATDHPDAPGLMFRAYRKAVSPNALEQFEFKFPDLDEGELGDPEPTV